MEWVALTVAVDFCCSDHRPLSRYRQAATEQQTRPVVCRSLDCRSKSRRRRFTNPFTINSNICLCQSALGCGSHGSNGFGRKAITAEFYNDQQPSWWGSVITLRLTTQNLPSYWPVLCFATDPHQEGCWYSRPTFFYNLQYKMIV